MSTVNVQQECAWKSYDYSDWQEAQPTSEVYNSYESSGLPWAAAVAGRCGAVVWRRGTLSGGRSRVAANRLHLVFYPIQNNLALGLHLCHLLR